MEDRSIIDLYFRRSEQAIDETRRKYGPYCGAIARRILTRREDAEECVSDTWFAAWTRIPPTVPVCLRAFLGRIVRDLSISRYRAEHAQKRYSGLESLLSELEDCLPAAESVEQALDRSLLSDCISRWLDGLSESDRRLFVRRYWHGYPVKTLAAEAGTTQNLMAQRLLRLRRKLKTALETEGFHP